MKRLFLLTAALLFSLLTIAQTAFETYFRRIPPLPRDSCNITRQSKDAFEEKVNSLIDEISEDIDARNRKANEYAEGNRGSMEANAIKNLQQQYNISDEDINKMKSSKGMTEAEKKAMANNIMMQQTNISMEEAQKLAKMSEAGKKAWAEAYAAEAQANAQSSPKAAAAPAGMPGSAMALSKLQQEQQSLIGRINSGNERIAARYAAIDNDPSGKIMLNNISIWNSKLTSMMGIVSDKEAKTMDSLSVLISREQKKYCDKFTPGYRTVLRDDLANLKASVRDYNRLDQVTGDIMKTQTGVAPAPEMSEISSLSALKGYLGHLKDAYKYKLSYPEE
ncbi:MAG: hypothetical protein MUE74_10280 [Bacteroidales bacterium]|jgi:hypothetical protein|nr:hypothetical protein [Bacteroidales bacterium]